MLLILVLVILGLVFYLLLVKPQTYWKSKNVKQGLPIPIFGDSFKTTFGLKSMMQMNKRIYDRFPNERYSGIYQGVIPTLILRDPDLIKQITVKDFDHFVDRFTSVAADVETAFAESLLFLKTTKWREMRTILNPAFTGAKMRSMFDLMDGSARQYVDFFLRQRPQGNDVIEQELKESFTRFANDVIANCAFGVRVDSFKEPANSFFAHSQVLTNAKGTRAAILMMIGLIMPKLIRILGLTLFPKKTTEFFQNLFKRSVKMRREKNIDRPDIINLLTEAQNGRLTHDEEDLADPNQISERYQRFVTLEGTRKKLLSEDEMVAQLLLFFYAGPETISNAATFLCYELAVNPDVQNTLRREVDQTNQENNGRITFDVLNKMKYLDMCVSENLRKHPPVPLIDRICTKAYTIQPKKADEEPLQLTPGDVVRLPIAGLHHDEKYYEKPEQFDPERFSDARKATITPYTYIPFGSGPRNCIASRFALMEVKTLIFHVLSGFELVVIDKTTIPLKYDAGVTNPAILGGCWVGFKQRHNF